ncbi:MAG: hypothetical protein MJA30_35925, partial [Cytophagales bacterium]|nr:hypothetical protein [Cytophagales bacterium]
MYSEEDGYNNQINWKLREGRDGEGIASAFLSIIVAPVTGPFQAVVQATARTQWRSRLCYLPWPRDYPVLFDDVTEKWIEPVTGEFDLMATTEGGWERWVTRLQGREFWLGT